MGRFLFSFALFLALTGAVFGVTYLSFTEYSTLQVNRTNEARRYLRGQLIREKREAALQLPPHLWSLASESRKSILKTGMSSEFFDSHIVLLGVDGESGNRKVHWLLLVGDYEVELTDTITFVEQVGRQHSLPKQLRRTTSIGDVITLFQAKTLLEECLGPFSDGTVQYRARSIDSKAQLVFTGRGFRTSANGNQSTFIGSIDLETSECSISPWR